MRRCGQDGRTAEWARDMNVSIWLDRRNWLPI